MCKLADRNDYYFGLISISIPSSIEIKFSDDDVNNINSGQNSWALNVYRGVKRRTGSINQMSGH